MFVIVGRFWNNGPWIKSALQHIDAWKADRVILFEGCWDNTKAARSTDRTRAMLDTYVSENGNVSVYDVVRTSDNPRENQAACSALAQRRAYCEPGDWIMVVDADVFWPVKTIQEVKAAMGGEYPPSYFRAGIRAFLNGLDACQRLDNGSRFLPYRIDRDMRWIPTCHPAIDGTRYEDIDGMPFQTIRHDGLHYEMMHPPQRLFDRYSIGDRKTPLAFGRLDKPLIHFDGKHSAFAIDALKNLGYDCTDLWIENPNGIRY